MSCLWLLALLLGPASGYRILGFFPFPATSHQNAIAPILHRLAVRGHEVVYLTPVPPALSHPNLDVRPIRPFLKEYLDLLNLTAMSIASIPRISYMISECTMAVSSFFFNDPAAQEIIHGSDKFDAVLMESAFAQEPVASLIHKFGCVGIEVETMGDCAWVNELSGLPDNPAYQMDFKSEVTNSMTFTERLYNFYSKWSTVLVSYYQLQRMQGLMDKYFNYTGWESRPPISTLVSNKSLVLINQDVLLGYPFPLAPHVKLIGGINIVPTKPLPKDIQTFMDNAKSGVILFSLGSNLKTSEISTGAFGQAFLSTFEKIPQKVIMKWEAEEIPDFIKNSKNIMTSKWLPQQDILAHKNCILFITHGGYQSLLEAVHNAVPIIGIPFFGDQPKNVLLVSDAGLGVMLKRNNVTEESVSWAIKESLTNPRYKNEVQKRSKMAKERRHSSLDEAEYWVEFAIKYPNALTPKSAFLPFVQLYQIDIFLFISLCLYLIYKMFIFIFSFGRQKPLKRKEKVN